MKKWIRGAVGFGAAVPLLAAAAPDTIFLQGRIVTVDPVFSIHEAMAVEAGRISAVGTRAEIEELRGARTRVVDLQGRTVLPGLIDSHVHITGAAMTEYYHPLPSMETIADVLSFIRARTEELEDGEWIFLRQVFITRLREQRYPTREELDRAAPNNPVNFATGPDSMLNSMALAVSGIDRDFQLPEDETGQVERDEDGEPTGMLRGLRGRHVAMVLPGRPPTEQDHYERVQELLQDYLSNGLTTVADRDATPDMLDRFARMRSEGELPLRLVVYHSLDTDLPISEVTGNIRRIARHPWREGGDDRLRLAGVKVFLDGGMLTGSAYMREPWGVSEIYGINDPGYRGVLSIPKQRLRSMVAEAVRQDLQFTAHAVGDGAVHLLLDVYGDVAKERSIGAARPNITHSNFMSLETVRVAARLGVTIDIQPVWLYMDGATLLKQFGTERMRYFQPLQTLFREGAVAGGGSDHMQKIGAMRAVNPYNPFFGMWIALTREMRWSEERLNAGEALNREQAIRFYTANNAWLLKMEDDIGSLELGKRADFVVLDRDILTCPLDEVRDIQVLGTWIDGREAARR